MTDQAIDDIRRVRRAISAEIGPELVGMVDRYTKMETKFNRPPLTPKDRRIIRCAEAAKSGDLAFEKPSSPLGDR